jgi:hypothetical protein
MEMLRCLSGKPLDVRTEFSGKKISKLSNRPDVAVFYCPWCIPLLGGDFKKNILFILGCDIQQLILRYVFPVVVS